MLHITVRFLALLFCLTPLTAQAEIGPPQPGLSIGPGSTLPLGPGIPTTAL